MRIFVSRKVLSRKHLDHLLSLQQIYPEGLMDTNWQPEHLRESSVITLMQVWREKRPESCPPAPLWRCSQAIVENSPHITTLQDSYRILLTYVQDSQFTIPQWLIAAWWWGCAVVVCHTSASLLKEAIEGWSNRYKCAIVYLQSQGFERDRDLLAAYRADLVFSNSATIPQMIKDTWAIRKGFQWNAWQLPSELQPWGTNSEQGKLIMNQAKQKRQMSFELKS
ncbi:MAG: hypothetical protein F6K24_50515 [Okeania sp. SIO2D1]|nr:hypothetical protein [Okeania sp. SIO2D1]